MSLNSKFSPIVTKEKSSFSYKNRKQKIEDDKILNFKSKNIIYSLGKRFIDLAISFFILFFIFPWLCPIIAMLIRLTSKGPIFLFNREQVVVDK